MKRRVLISVGVLVGGGWVMVPATAYADTTLAVNTVTDSISSSNCSLRAAVQYVNATAGSPIAASTNGCVPAGGFPAGAVTITVPSSAAHYTLGAGIQLTLTGSEAVTIAGGGAAGTVLDGNGTSRVFAIGSLAKVTITGVTLTGGYAGTYGTTGLNGGAVLNQGSLTLSDVVLSGNHTAAGGNGASAGAVGGNGGSGGAIFNDGGATLTISDSTISGNSTGAGGTGAAGGSGTQGSGGSASTPGGGGGSGGTGGDGGGIANLGTLSIVRATVTGNSTGPGGNGGNGGNGGSGYFQGDSSVCGYTDYVGGTGGYGGWGGAPGSGGGIYDVRGGLGYVAAAVAPTTGPANITVTGSDISGNATGAGGNGGAGGTGGIASSGLIGGNGGTAGTGAAANGWIGSAGAGLAIDSPTAAAMIANTTISSNTTGRGGAGGNAGAGGSAGAFNDCNGAATTGAAGTAGAGGAGGDGAAIGVTASYQSANGTVLQNSTLASNSVGVGGSYGGGVSATASPGKGGGVFLDGGVASVNQSTVVKNTGTGLVVDFAGSINVANSVIAANSVPNGPTLHPNCQALDGAAASVFNDQGYNVYAGDTVGCPTNGTGSASVVDAKLGTLGAHGGHLQTMPILLGSPAIDRVPTNTCPNTTDERGVARPQGAGCDSGAYELAPPTIATPGAAANGTTSGTVTASISPNGQATNVTVVYGTTPSYGQSSPGQALPASNTASGYSAALTGLTANTTYHAQITATNSDGSTVSSDLSFTTPPAPLVQSQVTGTVPTAGFGSPHAVHVTVVGATGAATGTVSASVNGQTYTASLAGGAAVIGVSRYLPVGTWTIRLSYSGDATYSASSTAITARVVKAKTSVSVGKVAIVKRTGAWLIPTIVRPASGTVAPTAYIYLYKGRTLIGKWKLFRGRVTIVMYAKQVKEYLPVGKKVLLTVRYRGDGHYLASAKTLTVIRR